MANIVTSVTTVTIVISVAWGPWLSHGLHLSPNRLHFPYPDLLLFPQVFPHLPTQYTVWLHCVTIGKGVTLSDNPYPWLPWPPWGTLSDNPHSISLVTHGNQTSPSPHA